MKPVSRAVLCVVLGAAAALAQSVISARSGMLHYVEGRVFLGDQAVESKFGSYPEVKENGILRTEAGRAEVLLTPGVFLRLAENSEIRMITNRLVDTRIEFLAGAAVIEADDLLKDNSVTVVYKDATAHLLKKGLYRFDASPATLRVFDGEAGVAAGGPTVDVKDGKMITLDSGLAVAKFDKDDTDALDRWSRRRGEYVAMANVSAANSIRRSGTSWASGGWAFNPYFGMFTFVPMNGAYYSPYGYRFWSPMAVYQLYRPRPVFMPGGYGGGGYNANAGYRSMPQTSSGYSGVIASAPAVSAPAAHAPSTSSAGAASAPVSRGGGSSGGGAHR